MRDSDKAYFEILEMLIVGKVRCGQPVDEKNLCERLGLGKTPLREALTRLAQDGYVVAVPRKGMTYISFDISDLNTLFDMRLALNNIYTEKIIDNISDYQIQTLEEIIASTFEDAYLKDRVFYTLLSEGCNDKYLAEIMNKLKNLCLIALRPLQKNLSVQLDHIDVEYMQIVQALKARSKEQLSKLLIQQIPAYVTVSYR